MPKFRYKRSVLEKMNESGQLTEKITRESVAITVVPIEKILMILIVLAEMLS